MTQGSRSPLAGVRASLEADQRAGYSNVDMGRATRLGAVLWMIAAICLTALLPVSPPTDAIGPAAGWLLAAAITLGCAVGAVRLVTKGAQINPNELYAMSFVAIGSIATLEWLAGGSETPYHLLYILSAVYTGCPHTPRRVLAYIAVLAPVMAASLLYGQLSSPEAAHVVLQYVLSAGLCGVGLVLMASMRAQHSVLEVEGREARELAGRDFLTGLGNRRRLIEDLERCFADGAPEHVLAIFDLDGFKAYNDSYGHAAGDDLLARLAHQLQESTRGHATAYRMGGDEFCVLAPSREGGADEAIARAGDALRDEGEGFTIGSSYGIVVVPEEAASPVAALRTADQRMYAQKNRGRASAGVQTTEVLLQVLSERKHSLGTTVDDVKSLCEAVGRRVGLAEEDLGPLLQAASLHDVGKSAIPDSILNKAGPLTDEEWSFMRRHTVIAERILLAAPSLTAAARLVRSSHERWDGGGYPDGLAGEDIPLAARVIYVCDAFDAMTTERPYRHAITRDEAFAELRRCAGTQFDPRVVDAFADALAASQTEAV